MALCRVDPYATGHKYKGMVHRQIENLHIGQTQNSTNRLQVTVLLEVMDSCTRDAIERPTRGVLST